MKYILYIWSIFIIISFVSCTSKQNDTLDDEQYNCESVNNQLDIENQIFYCIINDLYTALDDTIFTRNGRIDRIRKNKSPDIIILKYTYENQYIVRESDLKELQDFGLTSLTSELLSDYIKKNKRSKRVGPFTTYQGEILYLSIDEVRSIYNQNSLELGPVKRTMENGPILNPIGKPFISFSNPGFDKDKNMALIEFSEEYYDSGAILILENGCWKIKEQVTFLII